MANVARKAIIKALLNGTLTDIMVKTTSEQVFVDDTTTLADKLASIITDLALKADTTDVQTLVTNEVNKLIAGAPETYDTLKEIADYISSHQSTVDAINSAIGSKADKTTVEAIQTQISTLGTLATKDQITETDLESTLASKINSVAQSNHSHSNKTVLDAITESKVASWDTKADIFFSETQPSNLTTNDLWLQITE